MEMKEAMFYVYVAHDCGRGYEQNDLLRTDVCLAKWAALS
jgi:hypothetical protein